MSSHTSLSRRLQFESLEDRRLMSAGKTLLVFPDRFENDNMPGRAKTIAKEGGLQAHSLHAPTDVDWVKFTLSAASNAIIQTDGRAGDTEMWLFGPNSSSNQIAYDNDGNGSFSRIRCQDDHALGPGTYYVKVGEHGSDQTIGRYTISVKATRVPPPDAYEADAADNTADYATTIVVDAGPQTHSIHVTSDVDWVSFTLVAQSDIIIETRGASGNTQLWLYGQDASTPIVFNDNSGVGDFSLILRTGPDALPAGTYYAKVAEASQDSTIPSYTISVTALQPGDVLLEQSADGLSAAIRWGESRQLGVSFADTFSHSAIYLGNNQVAEMLARGYAVTPLPDAYAHATLIDIYRHRQVGAQGGAVAEAARDRDDTGYAYFQFAVLGLAAVMPGSPARIVASLPYRLYAATDAGANRMICSELVARVFAEVGLPISVRLWPTMRAMHKPSENFRMDFTTPTMLALSADLRRLNV